MDWGFIWIMLILKIPLIAVLCIVWWAIRSTPDPMAEENEASDDPPRRGPRPPAPPVPRRGPHGEPAIPSPPRSRTTTARSRVSSD